MSIWNEEEQGVFDEMHRRMHAIIEGTFSGMQGSLFDLEERCLKPLYKTEVTDGELVVTFDLPCVRKGDITLECSDSHLSIEAKMNKSVKLMIGGAHQRWVEFGRYSKQVTLPVKVDPKKAKATFRKGMLAIRFPVVQKGNRVVIR